MQSCTDIDKKIPENNLIKDLEIQIDLEYICNPARGISSFGRALAWHARGDRFDSGILHKQLKVATVAAFSCFTF